MPITLYLTADAFYNMLYHCYTTSLMNTIIHWNSSQAVASREYVPAKNAIEMGNFPYLDGGLASVTPYTVYVKC
jgi:hypothetical protein